MPIVQVKKVRGRFLHLFTAQPGKVDKVTGKVGDAKFNGNFIAARDSDAVKIVRRAMEDAATEKWGANGIKILNNFEASKLCLRDGDKLLDKDGNNRPEFEGQMFIVASNKTKPSTLTNTKDPETGKARVLETDDGSMRDGNYFNLSLDIYALDNPAEQIKGVFCTLRGVQFAERGEPLGGNSVAAADEFDCTEEDDDLGF